MTTETAGKLLTGKFERTRADLVIGELLDSICYMGTRLEAMEARLSELEKKNIANTLAGHSSEQLSDAGLHGRSRRASSYGRRGVLVKTDS